MNGLVLKRSLACRVEPSSVQCSFTDSYNNNYEPPPFGSILIGISVSDEKRAYANGAISVLAIGLVAAIFSFGAGLSAAQAIAGGLGNRALDPPFPDPRFQQTVALPVAKELPPIHDRVLGDVLGVLYAAEHILLLLEVLGDIGE